MATTEELWGDLRALYPAIKAGCLRGTHLRRPSRREVEGIIEATDPAWGEGESLLACRALGAPACLGALVEVYKRVAAALKASGEDTFAAEAALKLCLGEGRQHPAPWQSDREASDVA